MTGNKKYFNKLPMTMVYII